MTAESRDSYVGENKDEISVGSHLPSSLASTDNWTIVVHP